MRKRILGIVLAVLTLFSASVVSCGKKEPAGIRIYTLNGTTGFGMAKLMSDDAKAEKAKYTFTVKEDASEVTAALLNGDADIAALPTNAAANLYQKSGGAVQILAVNTLGCLYLVNTTGTKLSSFSELEGKTVYAPAQNPSFIFTGICNEQGVHVTLDSTSYAKPAALKDAVASGAVEYAVLPEPMVTIAKAGASKAGIAVSVDFDLTAVWDENADNAGKLVQGCVVVRSDFAKEYPDTVKDFLTSYKESVEFVAAPENAKAASEMIVANGVFSNATVAENALPKCNVKYLDGQEMKAAMQVYLQVLYSVNPQSVGNAIPDDGFYYFAK